MSAKSNQRIETGGEASPLLHSPFDALQSLDTTSLPAGNDLPPPSPAKAEAIPSKGRLILRREKKERGGKTVVIISGFEPQRGWNSKTLEPLARELRQTIGCGGSVEGREIMLQGDQPERVAEALEKKGFRVAGVTKSV